MPTYFCIVAVVVGFLTTSLNTACEGADPGKPGPYSVGVRTEVFVDEKRECAITGKPRTLVTEIWYPVAEQSDEQPLNKFSDFWGRPEGIAAGRLVIGRFGGDFDKVETTFKNVARRNARIRDGAFPLLVFSHGNGGFRHQNTFQAEYLASHGYIVAAADHTGNAAVTVLPDQIVPYTSDTRQNERSDDRPHDVSFLISRLSQLNHSEDHWLHGHVADGQCGAFGHSFGGFTVCRAAELDSRIKAILPMTLTDAVRDDDEGNACKIPLLLVLGDTDRTVGDAGNARSMAYFEQAARPKYLLNFKKAGHYTFTEMPQINPQWGDGVGVEKGKEGQPDFQFSDAVEDQRITNEYSAAFFDTFLKNSATAKAFLDRGLDSDELDYQRE